MLYERWREIARERADETALIDAASGRRWTFAALDEASTPPSTEKRMAFAHGRGPEFVITVLRAWRHGRAVCPIETGQPMPSVLPPPGCVHVKLTSASTGRARMVAFTAGQLAADARQIVSSMGLHPGAPNLGVISLAHSYGFSSLVTPLLLHGIPLILGGSPLPESVRRMAAMADRVTVPAVPAMWSAWHLADAIPPNTALAISAGAPLPLTLEAAVHEQRGLKIHNFYGSTECGGIAFDRTEVPRTDAAIAGTALDGVSVGIGVGGCLEVSGPAVGTTYWPEPADALAGGRFRTEDLAEIQGGVVRLLGRATDVMNIAGRKLEPERVEEALRTHDGVRECVVFGVTLEEDPSRGDQIVACISGDATESALREHLQRLLPAWQQPRHWWRPEALEVNARGKLPRTEWRRRWLGQAGGPAGPAVNRPPG